MNTQPVDMSTIGIMQVPSPAVAPAVSSAPLDGALRMIALGVPVAWTKAGEKEPPMPDFPTLATTSKELVMRWATQRPGCNWICVARPNEYCFLDEDDSARIRTEYERVYGEPFPKTWTTESQAGHRQSIWKQTDATRKLGNKTQGSFRDAIMSFRQDGQYVLAAMSHLNPDTKKGTGHRDYVVVDESPIIEMPDSVVELIYSFLIPLKDKVTAKSLATNPEQKIPVHTRNETLASIAGKFQHTGMSNEGIREEIHRINEERCEQPLSVDEVDAILNSILRYEKGNLLQDVVIINSTPSPAKIVHLHSLGRNGRTISGMSRRLLPMNQSRGRTRILSGI
jgi:Bifunctional DNA primase/polymerase, N-terminal/Primase C terminal 1 (PriCT-1)